LLTIESFNVVARRKALHRVWKNNIVPYVAWVFAKFPDVRGFGNEDLIVMQCENHLQLEELVQHLLASGLDMTRDGAFEDFAFVHATRGISLPCSWLDYRRDSDGGTVSLKADDDSLDLSSAGYGYEGPALILPKGYGFVISQQDDHDVWLDFNTGWRVVTLHPTSPPRHHDPYRLTTQLSDPGDNLVTAAN
jgi:hypothetical protein